MTMADEEMVALKELDKDLLSRHGNKIFYYFADNDAWVGENRESILREIIGGTTPSRIVHGNAPHAYGLEGRFLDCIPIYHFDEAIPMQKRQIC